MTFMCPLFRDLPFTHRLRPHPLFCLLLAGLTSLLWLPGMHAQLPGSLKPDFAPTVRINGSVSVIAAQADGKLVVGGRFYRVGAASSSSVVRLNADGTVDPTFVPPSDLTRTSYLAIAPDGKIILLQTDPNSDAYPTPYTLLRLNPDGSRDPAFIPATFTASYSPGLSVLEVAVQSDGRVLVGGAFNQGINASVVRYNTDGSPDTGFQAFPDSFSNAVDALLPLPNGQTLVAGSESDSNSAGTTRKIFRLNADGSLDQSFTPAIGGRQVLALASTLR